MKRFVFLLIIPLVFLSSCKKEPKKTDYIWTGQADRLDIEGPVPVCIIWHKYVQPPTDAWMPYKSFNQNDANEMREIILQLLRPEEEEPNPDLRTKDKLSLIFYNGFPEKLKVKEVYFDIKDQAFIGPTGKSRKLCQILVARQEINRFFYSPYLELGAGHYRDDFLRIKEIQESQYNELNRRKAEKETEYKKKVEEANQESKDANAPATER